MKKIYFCVLFLAIALSIDPFRILQNLRVLDEACSYNGYLYKTTCFCSPGWEGAKCEKKKSAGYVNDVDTICDDLLNRLDNLANISPYKGGYLGDDPEFSRWKKESIGKGDAAYGEKASTWIRMHDITEDFHIFGGTFNANDIAQGSLGNCYLLAALASLQNPRNGEYIRNIFKTQTDNDNHVYVTRWMIDGKPRFVAVDDWVPGSGKNPSFSKPTADHDYWSMILEKSWAKIHANYMLTEGGSSSNIWKSLTQAPNYAVSHRSAPIPTPDRIFDLIYANFNKGYPMGCSTSKDAANEVGGHAYSVLGAYNFTNSSGASIKLIKVYNPWGKEVWKANPWGDESPNWTIENKAFVNLTVKNDGIFYNTPEDYLSNFASSTWSAVQPNYEVSYVDIPLDTQNLGVQKDYNTTFKVNFGENKGPIYVYIDTPDWRLFSNEFNITCNSTYTLKNNYKATSSSGKVFKIQSTGSELLLILEENGDYTFNLQVINNFRYSRYVTVTAYHPIGSFKFTQNHTIDQGKDCPNQCNNQGQCNFFNGLCTCNPGFAGADCSQIVKVACQDNCGYPTRGTCNENNGTCTCNGGFMAPFCAPCTDLRNCSSNSKVWCDETHTNFNFMQAYCQAYCGANHFKSFGECYIPQTDCLNSCNGNGFCNKTDWKCKCKPGFTNEDCKPCQDRINYCVNRSKAECEITHKNYKWMSYNCPAFCGANHFEGYGDCYVPRTSCTNCLDCNTTNFTCNKCMPGFEGPDCDPCKNVYDKCSTYSKTWCEVGSKNYGYMMNNCKKYCGEQGSDNVGTCKI